MQVNRKNLIEILETCRPALATQSRATELTHFWFDGHTVMASNGHLIISMPCTLDIVGGVPYALLDWLKKSKGDSAIFSSSGNGMAATIGRSKFNFPLLDIKRRAFHLKTDNTLQAIPLTLELIAALNNISVSYDPKAGNPAKMGVFFRPNTDHLDLYATDDITLSYQPVPIPMRELPKLFVMLSHVVVPFDFIQQLINYKVFKEADGLYLSDYRIVLEAGLVTMTSTLIECPTMPPFSKIIESFEGDRIALPENVGEALDRLSLVPGPVEVELDNDLLQLSTGEGGNRIEERFSIANDDPDGIMIKLDLKLLKRVLPGVTHFTIKKNGMCLTGSEQFTHIMAGAK
jgi:DNA polymerase III sliding clamp (beta) subunit (PCNA family)